ncbi:hypothetical protein RUND412_008329 [Rhizina undulata]
MTISGLSVSKPSFMTLEALGKLIPLPRKETQSVKSLPSGFVLGGDVQLFGTESLRAKFYSLCGSTATGKTGLKELVTLGEKIFLSQLLQHLNGGPWADVVLGNPQFLYLETEDQLTPRSAGLWCETDILFDGPLEGIKTVLLKIFNVSKPSLHVTGFVSRTPEWTKPLEIGEKFLLSGSFFGIDARISELLAFTSVGVEFAVTSKEKVMGHNDYDCQYKFFGEANIKVPGSVMPLILRFELNDAEGEWELILGVEQWVNVAGFKGLTLSDIKFSTKFLQANLDDVKDLSFNLKGDLHLGGNTISLEGEFGLGKFDLSTMLPIVTLETIDTLYTSITGRTLEFPKTHFFEFSSQTLNISSSGLSLTGVLILDRYHSSASAKLNLKRDGIQISGLLQPISLLPELTIKNAELNVFIGRTAESQNSTSRESGVKIKGEVEIHGIRAAVYVHTSIHQKNMVHWTVYGEVEGDMKLSRLCEDVKGTWMDWELAKFSIVASSVDGGVEADDWDIHGWEPGVQFMGKIQKIHQVDHLTRTKVEGLILRASFSIDKRFGFGIMLPSPMNLSFGPNISSGPLSIEVVASKMPQLIFSASLNVNVQNQKEPLVFTLGIKADLDSAEGFGQMTNYWLNPFGIHEKLSIGPNLCLEIGIIYAVLASTGTPSKIAFSGGLKVGETEAQFAAVISEHPKDQLVKAVVKELSLKDILDFIHTTFGGEKIPSPPEDILHFQDVEVYLSAGVSVGTTYYPSGIHVLGKMDLFGKRVEGEFTLGSILKINAVVDSLHLGPLTIQGVDGGMPQITLEIGLKKQFVMIDGEINVGVGDGVTASIHAFVEALPEPDVTTKIKVDFARALKLELDGRITGAWGFGNMKGADFWVRAVVGQEIVQFLNTQVSQIIIFLFKGSKDGVEKLKEMLESAQIHGQVLLREFRTSLTEAQDELDSKRDDVEAALESAKGRFGQEIHEMQEDLHEARKEFTAVVQSVQGRLDQASIDRVTRVNALALEIRQKRKHFGVIINEHLNRVRMVKEEVKGRWGVENEVTKAREIVEKKKVVFHEEKAKLERAKLKFGEASFWCKIPKSIKVGRLIAVTTAVEAEYKEALSRLDKAENELGDPEYKSLFSTKQQAKAKIQGARIELAETVRNLEAKMKKRIEKLDNKIEILEKDLEEKIVGPEASKIQKVEKKLDEMKKNCDITLKVLEKKLESLPEGDLSKKVEIARKRLADSEVKWDALEITKEFIGLLDYSASILKNKGSGAASKDDSKAQGQDAEKLLRQFVDGATDVLAIRKFEIEGSVRKLIDGGIPLKAKVDLVVAGKEHSVEIGYCLGGAKKIVTGLVEKIWKVVNGFDK